MRAVLSFADIIKLSDEETELSDRPQDPIDGSGAFDRKRNQDRRRYAWKERRNYCDEKRSETVSGFFGSRGRYNRSGRRLSRSVLLFGYSPCGRNTSGTAAMLAEKNSEVNRRK
jgi:hypothetical protein